jgi:hypothetical protein
MNVVGNDIVSLIRGFNNSQTANKVNNMLKKDNTIVAHQTVSDWSNASLHLKPSLVISESKNLTGNSSSKHRNMNSSSSSSKKMTSSIN